LPLNSTNQRITRDHQAEQLQHTQQNDSITNTTSKSINSSKQLGFICSEEVGEKNNQEIEQYKEEQTETQFIDISTAFPQPRSLFFEVKRLFKKCIEIC